MLEILKSPCLAAILISVAKIPCFMGGSQRGVLLPRFDGGKVCQHRIHRCIRPYAAGFVNPAAHWCRTGRLVCLVGHLRPRQHRLVPSGLPVKEIQLDHDRGDCPRRVPLRWSVPRPPSANRRAQYRVGRLEQRHQAGGQTGNRWELPAERSKRQGDGTSQCRMSVRFL